MKSKYGSMNEAVTAAEMKALDAHTINDIGVPSMVLMERAALAVFEELTEPETGFEFDLSRTVCVCGAGNNGGDGFAVARLLHLAGYNAEILFVGDENKMSDETKQQATIARNYGLAMRSDINVLTESSLTSIVDALFGIGFSREVRGAYMETIHLINRAAAAVMAVDIPSGISADTGIPPGDPGIAVHAKETITFAYAKTGLLEEDAVKYVGKLKVKDIGIY